MKSLLPLFIGICLLSLSACSDDAEDIYVDDLKVEIKNDRIDKPTWLKNVVNEQIAEYKQAGYDQPWIDVRSVVKDTQTYILINSSATSGLMSEDSFYTLEGKLCICKETPCEYTTAGSKAINRIWSSWPY